MRILLEMGTFIVLLIVGWLIGMMLAGCDKSVEIKQPDKPVVATRLCINQCAMHRYKTNYDYWLTPDQNWTKSWYDCTAQLGGARCCKISEGYYGRCD